MVFVNNLLTNMSKYAIIRASKIGKPCVCANGADERKPRKSRYLSWQGGLYNVKERRKERGKD